MFEVKELKLTLELELSEVKFQKSIYVGGSPVEQVRWADGGPGSPQTLLYADVESQVVAIRHRDKKWKLVPYSNVAGMDVRGVAQCLPEDRDKAVAPEALEEEETQPKRKYRGRA